LFNCAAMLVPAAHAHSTVLLAGQPLKKTALNATHRALKAKMVDFGGWDMPVEYPGPGGG
jgi:hypothetical protein